MTLLLSSAGKSDPAPSAHGIALPIAVINHYYVAGMYFDRILS
jgi:hypothetical protein